MRACTGVAGLVAAAACGFTFRVRLLFGLLVCWLAGSQVFGADATQDQIFEDTRQVKKRSF
jgi:hypothetical protein